MAAVKTHDLKDYALIFSADIISGFSDDAAISIEYPNQMNETIFGTDGEATRKKSNNFFYAQVTISLMSTSDSNAKMLKVALLDALANGGKVPFGIKHLKGGESYSCDLAYLQGFPGAEINADPTSREWIVECPQLIPSGYGVGSA